MKQLFKYGILITAAGMGWWAFTYTQLHLCLTPSLDNVRALLFFKTNDVRQGDIVFIQGHSYKHLDVPLEKQIFAKRLIGLPGDRIIKDRTGLKIIRALPVLKETKEGYPLTPLATQIVPEGYVFVTGDHPRSVDSRYEEFGLVKQEEIWGKAVLTW